jgi:hypothetical protein
VLGESLWHGGIDGIPQKSDGVIIGHIRWVQGGLSSEGIVAVSDSEYFQLGVMHYCKH